MRLRILFAGSVLAAALTVGCAHNPCGTCGGRPPLSGRPYYPSGGPAVPAVPGVPVVPAAPVPISPTTTGFGTVANVPNGCGCR